MISTKVRRAKWKANVEWIFFHDKCQHIDQEWDRPLWSCCYQPLRVQTFTIVFSVPQFAVVNCVGQTIATKSPWSLSRNNFSGYNSPLNAWWGINLNYSVFPISLNNPFLCAHTERAKQAGWNPPTPFKLVRIWNRLRLLQCLFSHYWFPLQNFQ